MMRKLKHNKHLILLLTGLSVYCPLMKVLSVVRGHFHFYENVNVCKYIQTCQCTRMQMFVNPTTCQSKQIRKHFVSQHSFSPARRFVYHKLIIAFQPLSSGSRLSSPTFHPFYPGSHTLLPWFLPLFSWFLSIHSSRFTLILPYIQPLFLLDPISFSSGSRPLPFCLLPIDA